jgi:phage N-6-adenine-methyltransferase
MNQRTPISPTIVTDKECIVVTEQSTLTVIADQINDAAHRAESSARESLRHAKQAGELLLRVKAELPHGEFTGWVESQCEFSPRTARRFMKLADQWEELQTKTDTIVTDLGITEALKVLASDENVHFSSDSPEWYTPVEIIEATRGVMGRIDLDPCSNSTSEPNVPAELHYTIEQDGLSQPWSGRVYLNPPYGREIGKWVERLKSEYEARTVTEAIALLPARTDTAWFRSLREYGRCFLHGRLRFSDYDTGAPFPSVVFFFGSDRSRFAKVFDELGDVFVLFAMSDVPLVMEGIPT